MMFIFNYSSAVCISKDGKDALVMKYIPISYSKQCLYKVLISIILNLFPTVYLTLIEKFLLINIPNIMIFYSILISLEISIYTVFLGVRVDLRNPKIDWGQEYAVVKQNLNIMVQMGVNLLVFTITAILLFFVNWITNINFACIFTMLVYALLIRKVYYQFDSKKELFENIY